MSRNFSNLIPEIVTRDNMEAAFDEVVGDLKKYRRERFYAHRDAIIEKLTAEISTGHFRITEFQEYDVTDGGKVRHIKSPCVTDRIGCNAIIRVVEKRLNPTIIPTSAAAIKGRGTHRLFAKIRSDVAHDREGTRYFYESDIKKFYESINQDTVIAILRDKIHDPVLLPMLINFVTLLPSGLAVGLRSSQLFGNLVLSPLDHRMKETEHARYYYRYCDDIRVFAATKRECWHYRDVIHEEATKLGLIIKPNDAVRPLEVGNDFLGFVFYGDHTRIRKRIKHNAARKLHKVRSRRRRREIIGSFKGMAKWGDCKHLFYTLTKQKMDEEFGSLGWQYVAEDGKKRFNGKETSLRSLSNIRIKILDYEEDVKTRNGPRWLVAFQYESGEEDKYFTDDKEQKYFLKKMREMGKLGKIWTTIKPVPFGNGKVRYAFT